MAATPTLDALSREVADTNDRQESVFAAVQAVQLVLENQTVTMWELLADLRMLVGSKQFRDHIFAYPDSDFEEPFTDAIQRCHVDNAPLIAQLAAYAVNAMAIDIWGQRDSVDTAAFIDPWAAVAHSFSEFGRRAWARLRRALQ